MNYCLAYITTDASSYYELVKADSLEEAYEKVRNVIKTGGDIEICPTIE
jgi:hypothetical protein